MGPGTVGVGEAMVEARPLADAIEDMVESVLIVLPVGELAAVIGEHSIDLVWYSGDQVAQELSGDQLARFFVQRGRGTRADAVESAEPVGLTFFRQRGGGDPDGSRGVVLVFSCCSGAMTPGERRDSSGVWRAPLSPADL
jgi:hypothetical protein